MSPPDRTALFRKRALDAESKAFVAKAEESRRAWMIVARDWTKMAEREELKRIDAPAATLIHDSVGEVDDALRGLAKSVHSVDNRE